MHHATMYAPQKSPLLVLSTALALLFCASCQMTEPQEEEGTRIRGSLELLERLQPADVAVGPVRNQTGDPGLPSEALRQGFSEALVDRLYSPLDIAYVDANWVDASFRGTPAPDAILIAAFTVWDASHLYSDGDVRGVAELILFEGGSTTGTPLWGITHEATVNMGDGRGNAPSPSDDLIPRAARRLAEEMLSTLPERDPIAAHP